MPIALSRSSGATQVKHVNTGFGETITGDLGGFEGCIRRENRLAAYDWHTATKPRGILISIVIALGLQIQTAKRDIAV